MKWKVRYRYCMEDVLLVEAPEMAFGSEIEAAVRKALPEQWFDPAGSLEILDSKAEVETQD